jgi:hypothetical protein
LTRGRPGACSTPLRSGAQPRTSAPRNGPSVSPGNDPKEPPHGSAKICEGHEPPYVKFRDQKTPITHPFQCSGSSSRPMPSGLSRCSIPAEAAWRFDRRKLTTIELTYHLQHVGYSAVAQVRRQGCQPGGIPGLKAYERADGVVPAPGTAAMVGWTTDADRRSASCACRAVAGLAFDIRHGLLAD